MRVWRFWLRGVVVLGILWLTVLAASWLHLAADAQDNRLTDGARVTGNLDTPGAEEQWVFEAMAGDTVALGIEPQTEGFVPSLTISTPQGELLINVTYPSGYQGEFSITAGIARTGYHIVRIRGEKQTAGAYVLGFTVLERTAVPGDNWLIYGRSVEGRISDAAFRTFWSFTGTAGDIIDVLMTATSGDLDPWVALLGPDGTQLAGADGGGEGRNAALYAVRLPVNGTYTVVARRSGANFGEAGRTTGNYQLLVSLRKAGAGQQEQEPLSIQPGMAVRGRLTRAAPTMRYALDAQGVLVFKMQVAEPAQGLRLSVSTAEGAPLGTYAGFGTFAHSLVIPAGSGIRLGVSAFGSLVVDTVDFRLSVGTLTVATQSSSPLLPGERRLISAGEEGTRFWYVEGEAGDLVMLHMSPDMSLPNAMVRVTGPDGTPVLERALGQDVRQPLVLQQSGFYEIVVDEAAATAGYAIQIDLLGKRWRAFSQHLREHAAQPLPLNGANAELAADTADIWLVDSVEPLTWQFELAQRTGSAPLALQIETPSGRLVDTAVTDPFLMRASLYAVLQETGRYRIRVFALDGSEARYMLRATVSSGGELLLDERTKGVLLPDGWTHRWWIEAPSQAVLSIDVQPLTTQAPDVILLDPTGLVLTSSLQEGVASLRGIPLRSGGRYHVLVIGQVTSARSVYYLTAHLEQTGVQTGRSFSEVSLSSAGAESLASPQRVTISDLILPVWSDTTQSAQSTTRLQPDAPVRGEIPAGQFVQTWTFSANAGQTLTFTVIPEQGTPSVALVLLDATGMVIAEERRSGNAATALTYSFLTGGEYHLAVSTRDGRRYLLWAEEVENFDPRALQVVPGTALSPGDTVRAVLEPEASSSDFAFWGQGGDVLFASVYPDEEVPLVLALRDANGATLAAGAPVPDQAGGGVAVQATLPADGVYWLVVGAAETHLLDRPLFFDIHLNMVSSVQTRFPNGGALDGSVAAILPPTGRAHWLFAGTAGQRVRVGATPLDGGEIGSLVLSLADSGGTVFAQRQTHFDQRSAVLENIILPRSGVYQVIVEGRQGGRYRLDLAGNSVQQEAVSLALSYGTTAVGLLTTEDVLDAWTWGGSGGDVIGIAVRQTAGRPALLTMQVRARDGRVLATAVARADGYARVEHLELPLDGHYTVLIGTPQQDVDGVAYAVSIYLETTTARSMGGVIVPGETWTGTLTVDDPTDVWLVEGRDGDTFTVTVSPHDQRFSPSVSWVDTDWHRGGVNETPAVLTEAQSVNGQAVQFSYTLSTSGPYAVVVETPQRGFGSYDITVTRQAESQSPAKRLRLDQTHKGELGLPVLTNTWQFEGQAGTSVTLTAAPDSRAALALHLTLSAPDGSPLAQAESGYGRTVSIANYELPFSGTYTVDVSLAQGAPFGAAGHYALLWQQATDVRPATGLIQPGRPVLDSLDSDEPVRWWKFSGQMGEAVRITARATSGSLDPTVALYSGTGSLLAWADDVQGLDAILTTTLPQDGEYLIRLARYGSSLGQTAGNFSLLFEQVYRPATERIEAGTLFYGDRVSGTLDRQNAEARWAFWGAVGDVVSVRARFPSADVPLLLTLTDPAGTSLASGVWESGASTVEALELPASGIYLVSLRRPGDARSAFSPYTLSLEIADWRAIALTTPGVLGVQQPVASQIAPGQTHVWQFYGTAGQRIACTVLGQGRVPALTAALYGPDGRLIWEGQSVHETGVALISRAVALPADGVYTLILRPLAAVQSTQVYRLHLQTDLGRTAPVASLTLGEDSFGLLDDYKPSDTWVLELHRQDIVFLRLSLLSGNLSPVVTLIDPAGKPMAQGVLEQTEAGTQVVIGPLQVSQSGSYRVVVARQGDIAVLGSGRYRLTVRQVPLSSEAAAAQPLTFGVPVWDTLAGSETRSYVFSGLAGDLVTISLLRTEGQTLPRLALETEAGRPIQARIVTGSDELGIPLFVVPRSGHYVIRVSADNPLGYGLYVVRRSPEAPAEGPLRQLGVGRRLVEALQEPGQITRWRFAGQQGEVLSFTVTATGEALHPDVTLYGPSGYLAAEAAVASNEVVIGPVRLPETGEYLLVVRAWRNAAGSATGGYSVLAERAPEEVSGSSGGSIPAPGFWVFGGLVSFDPADTWVFGGEAGEILKASLETSRPEVPVEITLTAPDGTLLAAHRSGQGIATLQGKSLPVDGDYTVRISARLAPGLAIEYRLAVTVDTGITAEAFRLPRGIEIGQPSQGRLSAATPSETWVFYGQAGQTFNATVTLQAREAGAGLALALVDVSGEVLRAGTIEAGARKGTVGPVLLPQTGFYGVVASLGPAQLTDASEVLYEVVVEISAPQAEDMGTLESTGEGWLTGGVSVHEWHIRPAHTGMYRMVAQSLTPGQYPAIIVLSSAGDTVAYAAPPESVRRYATALLTGGEQYRLIVANAAGPGDLDYRLEMFPESYEAEGGMIRPGEENVGRLDDHHFFAQWAVRGQGSQGVRIEIQPIEGTLVPALAVYDRAGTLLAMGMVKDDGRCFAEIRLPPEGLAYALIAREGGASGQTQGDYKITVMPTGP